MNRKDLEELLNTVVVSLFKNQPDIYDFTSETGQTEWNLAHHLANEVHKFFPEFNCDLDVMKLNYEMRRPDIIIHKRGTHDSNFLVIEVKRNGSNIKVKEDIEKIKEFWFGNRLHYQFGAVINLKADRSGDVQVIERPAGT